MDYKYYGQFILLLAQLYVKPLNKLTAKSTVISLLISHNTYNSTARGQRI